MVLKAQYEIILGLHGICIRNICVSKSNFEVENAESELVMTKGSRILLCIGLEKIDSLICVLVFRYTFLHYLVLKDRLQNRVSCVSLQISPLKFSPRYRLSLKNCSPLLHILFVRMYLV